jgi:hypothetical protein
MHSKHTRITLHSFPIATRLVAAAFLITMGGGYFAGLVQLHYQHGDSQNILPTADRAVEIYHGATEEQKKNAKSKFQKLLEADENLSFNGSGTMRAAFFKKSGSAFKKVEGKPEEASLRRLREGEITVLLDWTKLPDEELKTAYSKDELEITKDLELAEDFVKEEGGKRFALVKSILDERCVRCHQKEGGADKAAAAYPLEELKQLQPYLEVKTATPMELRKLAQTTHVHLLGFGMMFFLTGAIFSMTSYPAVIRVLFCAWPLIFQMIDISCWWLARIDPIFARCIVLTGGLVALGLGLQIVLTLLDLLIPRRATRLDE